MTIAIWLKKQLILIQYLYYLFEVEDFWEIFQFLKKPDNCKLGLELSLFRDQIKPMWEDEENKTGGKITLRLKKGCTNIVWEELILAFIGNNFPTKVRDNINGLIVNMKKDMNVIQLWFKNYANSIGEVEGFVRELVQVPENHDLEPKAFFRTYLY